MQLETRVAKGGEYFDRFSIDPDDQISDQRVTIVRLNVFVIRFYTYIYIYRDTFIEMRLFKS